VKLVDLLDGYLGNIDNNKKIIIKKKIKKEKEKTIF